MGNVWRVQSKDKKNVDGAQMKQTKKVCFILLGVKNKINIEMNVQWQPEGKRVY